MKGTLNGNDAGAAVDEPELTRARTAFVALGANLGDPLGQLRAAARAISELGTAVTKGPLYETAPVGGPAGQPNYLNTVIQFAPSGPYGEPLELLKALLNIERELGRERRERNGPRLIDLDLLDHGGVTLDLPATRSTPALKLPHPRLHERAFVLAPLCGLDPTWRHPTLRVTACQLLKARGSEGVTLLARGW